MIRDEEFIAQLHIGAVFHAGLFRFLTSRRFCRARPALTSVA